MKTTIEITGLKGSGKTTIFEKITALLLDEGYSVNELETHLEEHHILTKDGHEFELVCKQEMPSFTAKMSGVTDKFSVKLKNAMREIKHVVKENDIAAVVVLHEPGFAEYLVKIDPSWACTRVDGNAIVLRTNLLNHYLGNKVKFKTVTSDTSNMLSLITQTAGKVILPLMELSEQLDKNLGAQHTKSEHTPHDETPKNQLN